MTAPETPDELQARPWRSLGFFKPAKIENKASLWLSLTWFIESQGVGWEPFKGDVTTDLRHQEPDFYTSGLGWHPDGNANWIVVWASCDPTRIRWRVAPWQCTVETPEPYEVALIDNRRAEHCAPERISGERWFYRAFVTAERERSS